MFDRKNIRRFGVCNILPPDDAPTPRMNTRAAATQADVTRAIRAAQKAGLTVLRLVVRKDGIAVETAENGEQTITKAVEPEREVVL